MCKWVDSSSEWNASFSVILEGQIKEELQDFCLSFQSEKHGIEYRYCRRQFSTANNWSIVTWTQESVSLISSLWDLLLSCFYPCPVSKLFGPREVKFRIRAISFIFSDVFKSVRNVMPFGMHRWQAKHQSVKEGLVCPGFCEDYPIFFFFCLLSFGVHHDSVLCGYYYKIIVMFPGTVATVVFPSFKFTSNFC